MGVGVELEDLEMGQLTLARDQQGWNLQLHMKSRHPM
jgi:hypothetical protein